MKIRKHFSIKGKEWSLEYKWSLKAPDGDKVRGLCDFTTRTIYLDRLMPQDEKEEVFIHELIHAALFEAHLNEGSGLGGETEEIVCDAVSDLLTTLFTLRWKRQT